MTAQEKRQANRLVRNARTVEADLFELINELQEASVNGADPYDWESARDKLHTIQGHLPLLFDLVNNIQRAVEEQQVLGKERGL